MNKQKMEREYKRMRSVIASARKGQEFLQRTLSILENGNSTILTPEYRQKKADEYAKYQGFIDRANNRITELKREALQA